MDEQNNNQAGNALVSPRVLSQVARKGLEIIAEKYVTTFISRKKQEKIQIYVAYEDDGFIHLRKGLDFNIKSIHHPENRHNMPPEYVFSPISIEFGSHPKDTSKPIDIYIRHSYWQKEAEFLIQFMKEVMPEYFNKADIRIVNDFMTEEKKAKLEEIAAKYRKPAEDKW